MCTKTSISITKKKLCEISRNPEVGKTKSKMCEHPTLANSKFNPIQLTIGFTTYGRSISAIICFIQQKILGHFFPNIESSAFSFPRRKFTTPEASTLLKPSYRDILARRSIQRFQHFWQVVHCHVLHQEKFQSRAVQWVLCSNADDVTLPQITAIARVLIILGNFFS